MLGKYLHQYHKENLAHWPFEPLEYQVPILLNPPKHRTQWVKSHDQKHLIQNNRIEQQFMTVYDDTEKLHLVTKKSVLPQPIPSCSTDSN